MQGAETSARLLVLQLVLFLAAETPASPSGPDASLRYAEQITAENAGRRLIGGSDAIGGIGDWALGNGVLCAVVSDPSHEALLSPQGGVLIDLGRCGLAHDAWNSLESLLNMSRGQMLGASWIRAVPRTPDGSVALITGSRSRGLEIETTYRLGTDRPDVLRIETRATRLEASDDAERVFLFGDVVLHGRRQLAPFTLHLDTDGSNVLAEDSVGFAHPPVDPDDTLGMMRAILTANLHVLVGGDTQEPGVAYGLRLTEAKRIARDGSEQRLPFLSLNGQSFTMQGVFTRAFFVGGGSIGWLELAQTLLMDLAPGETLVFTRELLVGERSDVASVTDQLFSHHPVVAGRVSPAARVHVYTETGTPITQARPDATGSFSFRLPPGRYVLEARAPAVRPQSVSFEVTAAGAELGTIGLPKPGAVLLPRGRPMRLLFLPDPDGDPVQFGDDLLAFRVGDNAFRGGQYGPDVSLAGIAADPELQSLHPGRYRVIATRGPEYALTQAHIEVFAGETTALTIESPQRLLEHPGWVAADLHVHTEWSDDSNFPLERQLAAFVAEGGELIVSTEHDRIVDYAPVIERLGLSGRLSSLVGVEVTSSAHAGDSPYTSGHSNVFPLPHQPLAYRGGAPSAEGRRLRDVIGDVRRQPGPPLVQLNHPRSADGGVSDLNFFTHLSVAGEPYQPAAPLSAWPNRVLVEPSPESGIRDLDFDLIEMWNGQSMRKYRAVRADWYSLLLQGEFRPAVANSDSHVRAELIAYPRTYIRIPEPRLPGRDGAPSPLDTTALLAALRAGRAYGSSGPMLDVAVVGENGERAEIGDLYPGASGSLRVRVEAAPWVPVSELLVRSNGVVVHKGAIRAGQEVQIPLRFDADAFVTIEVRGEPVGDYAVVARGFEPFAFSNPIFVDADADGRFTAPGLPTAPLPVLDLPPPD